MYPRDSNGVGILQSRPTFGSLAPARVAITAPARMVPRTQTERNRELAAQLQFRPGVPALAFKMSPRTPPTPNAVRAPEPRPDVTRRLGMKVRRLRVARNLTQTKMAEEFGIDRTFLSDLECGRKSITLPTLETLARGFKMSLSELFEDV